MDHLAAFQEAARRENQGRDRTGWRYSKEARRLAVAYCHEERRSGCSFSTVAESLGITTLTLGRWLEEPAQPTFHQVEVRPAVQPAFAGPGLRVMLPSGLAIDGLNLAQVVELARLLP